MKAELELKWGTLKTWDFTDNPKAKPLLKEYFELGSSLSAMAQRDTPRQKEIICQLIDLCEEGTVYLSWDAKCVSNKEAKEYVLNYNND